MRCTHVHLKCAILPCDILSYVVHRNPSAKKEVKKFRGGMAPLALPPARVRHWWQHRGHLKYTSVFRIDQYLVYGYICT